MYSTCNSRTYIFKNNSRTKFATKFSYIIYIFFEVLNSNLNYVENCGEIKNVVDFIREAVKRYTIIRLLRV